MPVDLVEQDRGRVQEVRRRGRGAGAGARELLLEVRVDVDRGSHPGTSCQKFARPLTTRSLVTRTLAISGRQQLRGGTMNATPPPAVQMVQLLAGFQVSQALYAAAKVGLADALADGPRPVADVAETLQVHA